MIQSEQVATLFNLFICLLFRQKKKSKISNLLRDSTNATIFTKDYIISYSKWKSETPLRGLFRDSTNASIFTKDYITSYSKWKSETLLRGLKSEIPSGVGLGSSSACCVASAAAISGLFTKNSREEILQMAIEAEKTIFPNSSGADTTVCTFGGLMKYDKKNGYSKISCKNNFDFIITNSKIRHSTQKVVSNVEKFKKKNEKKFSSICDNVSKLIEDALISIKNNNLEGIGKNMTKNQEYLESIGVSNEKLRELIEISKKFSFGAKLTGAGDGGCIFSIVDKRDIKKTMRQLEKNNYECFSAKIDFLGLDTF